MRVQSLDSMHITGLGWSLKPAHGAVALLGRAVTLLCPPDPNLKWASSGVEGWLFLSSCGVRCGVFFFACCVLCSWIPALRVAHILSLTHWMLVFQDTLLLHETCWLWCVVTHCCKVYQAQKDHCFWKAVRAQQTLKVVVFTSSVMDSFWAEVSLSWGRGG